MDELINSDLLLGFFLLKFVSFLEAKQSESNFKSLFLALVQIPIDSIFCIEYLVVFWHCLE